MEALKKSNKPMVYNQNGVDVYYYNYKEPFMDFEDGYGFLGALAYSEDQKKIQCHFCGQFFKAIRYSHIEKCEGVKAYEKKHNVLIENCNDYKEAVGLNKSAVLVGEDTRLKLVARSQEPHRKAQRKDWFTEENKQKRRKKLVKANKRRTGEKISIEKRNKFGTCPAQLLERITEVHEALGHTPSKREFYDYYKGKYIGAIYQVYGSWVNAVEKAGYTPVSKQEGANYKYSDEELLQHLISFYERYGRLSTYSDHARGLLPSYDTYTTHFGGINKARRLAGLPVVYRAGAFNFIYDYSDCNPKYLTSAKESSNGQ